MTEILRATSVVKAYGPTIALSGVDLIVESGQIISVLGENGAGKSTLIKILTGLVAPDDGELSVNGERVTFDSPRQALSAGVSYIPQELSCVGPMTVAENLVLGSWPSRRGFTSKSAIVREARRICGETGIALPLDVRASALRLSELQELEITRALSRNAKIIL